MRWLRDLWLSVRLSLRPLGWALPAQPGWEALIQAVRSVDVYTAPGIVGAPYEWSLVRPNPEGGPGIPYSAICVDTGVHIDAHTGCRCARCGAPVAYKAAHMTFYTDPPACSTCVAAVHRAWRQHDR